MKKLVVLAVLILASVSWLVAESLGKWLKRWKIKEVFLLYTILKRKDYEKWKFYQTGIRS